MEPDTPSTDTPQDQERRIADFWNLARVHAKLSQIPAYFGVTALETLPPPTWSFGEGDEADALLHELLSAGRLRTSDPRRDYEEADAALPEVGTLGLVLDASGEPRALVVTSAVESDDSTVAEELTVLYAG